MSKTQESARHPLILCKPHGINIKICLRCLEGSKSRANEDRIEAPVTMEAFVAFQAKLEEFLHQNGFRLEPQGLIALTYPEGGCYGLIIRGVKKL
jgi:hypothetical protein